MKVYAVFSGSYSSRGLDGIFSSEEKAKEYIRVQKTLDRYSEVDDEPDEWIVDSEKVPETVFLCRDKMHNWNTDYSNKREEEIREDFERVEVRFDFNESRMYKAANDRAAMLKAREEGI